MGKQELANWGGVSPADTEENPSRPNESVYLVKVKPEKQTVKVYGEEKPLQMGMALEADILNERKKLYEWVLDPLYSITGKLKQ